MKLTKFDFQVLNKTEFGVNVKYKRYCYPDVTFPVVLIKRNGQKKIDYQATLKTQFNTFKKVKPFKELCYSFLKQNLSGKLNGNDWSFTHIYKRNNSVTGHWLLLLAENCEPDNLNSCKMPYLIITQAINLKSKGNNMSWNENITIHSPPNTNTIATTGAYRVSHLSNGNIKLEINLNVDQENQLNGYVIINSVK